MAPIGLPCPRIGTSLQPGVWALGGDNELQDNGNETHATPADAAALDALPIVRPRVLHRVAADSLAAVPEEAERHGGAVPSMQT